MPHVLRTFVTHPLVHIHQKKKIAPETAAKFASANGPYKREMLGTDNTVQYK